MEPAATVLMAATAASTTDKIYKSHPIPTNPIDESVHKLLPTEESPPPKKAMYRSKFAEEARREYVSGQKQSASMGPAKVQLNKAEAFLRKGAVQRPQIEKFMPDRSVRKAPVPKDTPNLAVPSKKDFIKSNALENINSVAKKPITNTPAYRRKADYGRTPAYLEQRKQLSEEARESKQRALAEAAEDDQSIQKNGMIRLPEEERVRVLEGLKANWEKLNLDYQKLSLTVDTVPKIARKVNMEQQLKQLEANISRFSHSNILVDFAF